MGYRDEEIMKERKSAAQAQMDALDEEQRERERQESIFDEFVHIEGREVRFARRPDEDVGISLYMPESFEKLDDETRKSFYPFGNPPKSVYADFETPFQITLNRTDSVVPDDGIPKFMKMSAKLLENYGPKSKILANGVVRLHDHNIGIMEAGTRAVDCNVHNVMFYVSVDDRVMIGNINFPTKYSKRMMPVAKQIIDSINFLTEEENNGDNNLSES